MYICLIIPFLKSFFESFQITFGLLGVCAILVSSYSYIDSSGDAHESYNYIDSSGDAC